MFLSRSDTSVGQFDRIFKLVSVVLTLDYFSEVTLAKDSSSSELLV